VKTPVHAAAGDANNFVGSHPMFGSERAGLAAANAAWVQGAPFALTRPPSTAPEAWAAANAWVLALGAAPSEWTPEAHDAAVARVSHLPQLVAYALMTAAGDDALRLQGPGFRDMTRLAWSPPKMWAEIVQANREPLRAALAEARAFLDRADALFDDAE